MEQPAKAVAAANYRNDWHIVWLTPGSIQWPKSCGCCRGVAQAKAGPQIDKLVGQKQLQYPICRGCRRHATLSERALYISLAIGFLAPGIAWLFFIGFPRPKAWVYLGPIWLVVGFLVTLMISTVVSKLVPGRTKRCATDGWPIELGAPPHELPLGGEKAERTDEREAREMGLRAAAESGADLVVLHVHNRDHALELIRMNGGSAQGIPTIERKY